ncbi:MAG: hypothetical protein ACP5E4_02895, partial [Candidatus Aenigmatarchaeota archaeon]
GKVHELEMMNTPGKEGRKFQYPERFVLFLLVIRSAFGLSYRILEGYSSEFFGERIRSKLDSMAEKEVLAKAMLWNVMQ